MNKKDYQTPTMKVVKLQHQGHILAASLYETTGTGRTSINAMEDETDLQYEPTKTEDDNEEE